MSFADLNRYLNDTDKTVSNSRPEEGKVDLDVDIGIELLRSLIAENEQLPSDDSELVELLQRLDSADTVAGEVEAKLDGILGMLDDLLDNLEPKNDNSREGDKSGPSSESVSPSKDSER